MAKCDFCGTTVLFGGKRDGDFRFCNEKCQQEGALLTVAAQVPDDVLNRHTIEVHAGNCPKCSGRGPVDVHTIHKIWSAFLLTSWSSRPQISCRSCGIKSRLGGAFFSLLFGWWGFPWGVIMTQVQVIRNLVGMLDGSDPSRPSEQLSNVLRINLAAQMVEQAGTDY